MNTYEALKQRTEARRKAMTPAQKRREFIRCQFSAKQCAKTTLFANVFGLSVSAVKPRTSGWGYKACY